MRLEETHLKIFQSHSVEAEEFKKAEDVDLWELIQLLEDMTSCRFEHLNRPAPSQCVASGASAGRRTRASGAPVSHLPCLFHRLLQLFEPRFLSVQMGLTVSGAP